MSTTLRIVSPIDATNVLFDLNDATNTYLLADVDFGAPALDATRTSSPSVSVGTTTFTRRMLSAMTLRVRIKGSSYDDLVTRVNTLSRYLAEGCTIQYVGHGSSVTRYFDIEPSATPAIVDGRDLALWQVAQAFDTPTGVTLRLVRQPYLRSSGLNPASNLLSNSTLLRDSNDDGTPEGWTKTSTPTLTIASSTDSFHAVCSATTQGIYQSTGAATAAPGQSWSFSAWVKVTSGTVALIIDWRTSGDASISTSSQTSTSSTWVRITASGTAPATTDHIRARIESSGAAATFDVRNVQLEQAAAATDYRVRHETLTMDPTTSGFTNLLPVVNPGHAPAPCVFTLSSPNSSAALVQADLGVRSNRDIEGLYTLADLLNGPNWARADSSVNGWTRTLDSTATAVADATGFGGNVVRITHATSPSTPKRRITLTRSTDVAALRGEMNVWARVKGSAQTRYMLQLRYAGGTTGPATEVLPTVAHDNTDVSSTYQWAWVHLGRMALPADAETSYGGLILELQTWIEDSTEGATPWYLYVNGFEFRAADQTAQITAPSGVETTYTPSTLSFAGSLDTAKIDQEAAGTIWFDPDPIASGETTYIDLPAIATAGYHTAEFTVRSWVGGSYPTVYYCALYLRNGATPVEVSVVSLSPNAEVTMQLGAYCDAGWFFRLVMNEQTPGWNAYQALGVIAASLLSSSVAGQNQSLVCDPGSVPNRSIVEHRATDGTYIGRWDATTVPFWLPPGLSLVSVNVGDYPETGYDEPSSDIARTVTVTPTLHPRYWT